ncbi:class II aldolase/adducin family protein [Streptomyces sp. WZ-12]|uniref:class II aldolase/adducin family protein n=1 Tax=Streptomyces sp. WZ-12 TaxID=3030210 RepID=UPI002380FBD4|nr:class II aldolase/adducin family protein [Streptomyces sp. WZ-12]
MGALPEELLPLPKDRWDPVAARGLSGRDEAIFRSHLVGSESALAKEGGGNFSVKGTVTDHCGRSTRVLWMSAWGCDGATTTDEDFPALRLDELLALRERDRLDEQEMVTHLVACGVTGEQRRPGIETLTHAFIPAAHVDHSHPDAVIALTSFPEGRKLAEEEFGDEAIWFDYRQFDIGVARELADRIAANPRCRFVLLANHGLFTWADTSEQCYRNSLEAVARSVAALGRVPRGPLDLGGRAVPALSGERAEAVLAEVLPALRGACFEGERGPVLQVDRSAATEEFVSSAQGPRASLRGPGCPDHLVTVGYRPLILGALTDPGRETVTALADGVERHRAWYRSYYEENITEAGRVGGRRSDAPRALVLPGIGVVTQGADAAAARLRRDHYRQTMTVVRVTEAVGGYLSLTEAQGVADEYWPLMRLKPQLKAADGLLAGKVVLVLGAGEASPDAAAVAELLAAQEAHVALAAGDRAAAERICGTYGERRVVALPGGGADPVRAAVLAYGGFDVVLDLAGGGRPDRTGAALDVMARQGHGGTFLLVAETSSAALRWAAAELDGRGAEHDVSAHAVATADPAALAETIVFLGGARRTRWQSISLEAAGR